MPATSNTRSRSEDADDEPGLAAGVAVRESQAEDELDDLVGDEVTEPDRHRVPRRRAVRADGLDLEAFPGGSSSSTSRATTSRASPTSLAMWSRIGGGTRDVVEVAASGIGHRLEQRLVEVVADAERRGRDTPGTELGGVMGQLVLVGDALRWRGRR